MFLESLLMIAHFDTCSVTIKKNCSVAVSASFFTTIHIQLYENKYFYN